MGRRLTLSWVVMVVLFAIYLAGLLLGWGVTASWHLLIVVAAILLIYNLSSIRGR